MPYMHNKVTYEVHTHQDSLKMTRTARLTLYASYRNGLYDTRVNTELDPDIAVFPSKFNFEEDNHLYHYASYIGIDAIAEAFKKDNGRLCVAYKPVGFFGRRIAGFLVFFEEVIDAQSMVYISHVSATPRGEGVGSKLIEALLASYPPNTVFYLCARKRNAEALNVYTKLGFGLDERYIETFGYRSEFFVGMSHKTSAPELAHIVRSFTSSSPPDDEIPSASTHANFSAGPF